MPLVLLLLAAVFVAKFAWFLSALALVVGCSWALGKWLAHRDDAAIGRRRRDAEICARADRQHAAVLAGDLGLGLYGRYPPAPL